MRERPSGLIVVKRASMYNDECFPEASVNDPRRADLVAKSEMSACLFCDDISAIVMGPTGTACRTVLPWRCLRAIK